MIQAIQTRYKGHKYRSRIEARWAVFFDALGIKFEYEKEGYVLPSGNYLPDFWLPEQKYWVEIKGQTPTEEEETFAEELAEHSGFPVFIFAGSITDLNEDVYPYVIAANVYRGYYVRDNNHLWCECPVCGNFEIQFEGRFDRMRCRDKCHSTEWRYSYSTARLVNAYRRAMAARFEFGETPR